MAPTQASTRRTDDKPVEYVKVCSLYGAGFYYIPGTDTCLKLGGFVRSEWLHNAGGSFVPFASGANARYTLTDTHDLISRARGLFTIDTRSQTEYGTLRTYTRMAGQWTTGDLQGGGSGLTVYFDRAFIQFAGFTFGAAQSFFDFFAYPTYSYQTNSIGSDTGGLGQNLWAYTAQLGNGLTFTLSFEDKTRHQVGVVDASPGGGFAGGITGANVTAALVAGGPIAFDGSNAAGQSIPDIVGALRVDQTWGSAQVAGVAHHISPGYYGANLTSNGHPDREWGWAVSGGIELNLPTGPGDKFAITGTWADGAVGHAVGTTIRGLAAFDNGGANGVAGGTFTWAPVADGIYGLNGQIETIEAWSVYAGLKHAWSPSLFSTIYGGVARFEWGQTASNLFCTGNANLALAGCDPNSGLVQIGSLTQWEPTKNFTIGLDIMYQKIESASLSTTGFFTTTGAVGARPLGTYKVDDVDRWHGVLRAQRNFWP